MPSRRARMWYNELDALWDEQGPSYSSYVGL